MESLAGYPGSTVLLCTSRDLHSNYAPRHPQIGGTYREMSPMSDQLIVERGGLEKKDKSELQAIVSALGGTATSRARKAELIDKILELSGATEASDDAAQAPADESPTDGAKSDSGDAESAGDSEAAAQQLFESKGSDGSDDSSEDSSSVGEAAGNDSSDAEADSAETASADAGDTDGVGADSASAEPADADAGRTGGKSGEQGASNKGSDSPRNTSRRSRSDGETGGERKGRSARSNSGRARSNGGTDADHPVGPDGEPLADWEVEVMADGDQGGGSQRGTKSRGRGGSGNSGQKGRNEGRQNEGRNEGRQNEGRNEGRQNEGRTDKGDDGRNDKNESREESDPNNRRGRRRGRGRGREDAGNEPVSAEPIPVAGALDLRDEGYGFLRVQGFLPSKEDVYVSVKQVRQYGLRKGDYLSGLARAANRNEKNPGFHLDRIGQLAVHPKRPRLDLASTT